MGRLNIVKTRAEIIDEIEQELQDTSNDIWTAAELGIILDHSLREISKYVPYQVKETVTTTADSRELDLSDITDLIGIEKLEYKVDQDPQEFKGWEIFGDTLTMECDTAPDDTYNVYLYCRKIHHLDADWVAATAYTLGQFVSPTTKNGYRYECTTAGTSDANEPAAWGTTVGGTTADNDVVWTCRDEKTNSLTPELEELLVGLTAARAALSKSVDYLNAVNQGGTRAPINYQQWAANKLAVVLSELIALRVPNTKRRYLE